MFGFLYALFMGGAYTAKGIRNSIENEEYKRKYRDDNAGTYYDRNMIRHDQNTGRIVSVRKDQKTGDAWVVDSLTLQPLRNITMNAAEQHYQEERKKFLAGKTNKTYVKYGNDEHRYDKCTGIRYKDLATGKLYVMRGIKERDPRFKKIQFRHFCDYLMDMETGKYIRPSDMDIFYTIYHGRTTDELYKRIEEENKKKEAFLKREKERHVLQSDYDRYYYDNSSKGFWDNNHELNDEQSVYPLQEVEKKNREKLGLL